MSNYLPKSLHTVILLFISSFLAAQDLRIYHGEKSESVILKQNDKLENSSKEVINIIRGVNGILTINILNPNPFFYNYTIKTDDVEIKDDYSDQFAALVKLINALPDLKDQNTTPFKNRVVRINPVSPTTFDKYQDYLEQLDGDIKRAKGFIDLSDKPETIEEALKRTINANGNGFRSAVDNILRLNATTCRFNSKTLEKDLNGILDKAINDNSFEKALGITGNSALKTLYQSAFKGLNTQLINTVSETLKIISKDRILRFQIPVKDNKQTNVKLVITKINDENSVVRDLLNEEIAIIKPLYVRKRFEVVPVVNLIFQSGRLIYAIENGVVVSKPDDDAKFNLGVMALMNFASFGEFKEYGIGIGVGYSIQPGGNANSIFAIPSLSYKSIFRIGFGFGFNLTPVGLKDGAKINMPLPTNITDIGDVIDYKRRPAAVFTLAISGFKF
jgi:DNA-binding phage protein